MKEYNKDKESLYLIYLDANNLQGGGGVGMFRRLHVKGFEWKKICQNLMNETSRSSLSFPFADLLSLFV